MKYLKINNNLFVENRKNLKIDLRKTPIFLILMMLCNYC